MTLPLWQKQRRTKEPLDESERGRVKKLENSRKTYTSASFTTIVFDCVDHNKLEDSL